MNAPIYPLYLDVPMMLSFLATLEGGIAFSSTVSQRKASTEDSAKEAEAGASIPAVLSLFSLNARGRLSAATGVDNSEEEEYVLQHTEASLFNRLYELITATDAKDNPGVVLDLNDPELHLVPESHFGSIAQIRGILSPNPLTQILDFYDVYGAFAKSKLIPNHQSNTNNSRRGSRQNADSQQKVTDDATAAIMSLIRDGMNQSGLTDILLTANDGAVVNNAVVTLKNDLDDASVIESAMGGYCTVLGKVTRISIDSDVSLLRRSIIGMMPESQISEMFQGFHNLKGIEININDHTVAAPVVQILPLAIFV